MKTINIVSTVTIGDSSSPYSEKFDKNKFNSVLDLPLNSKLSANGGYIIIQNNVIWNSDPEDNELILNDDPSYSLSLLNAGAKIFEGQEEVNFAFWEFSGAILKRKSQNKLSLVDYTCDSYITPRPYLREIEFNRDDFFSELIKASDELISFFREYTYFINHNLPESELRSSLLYSINLEGWEFQRSRIKI